MYCDEQRSAQHSGGPIGVCGYVISVLYAYYMRRLETEPGYRDKLTSEIKARWEKYRGTPPKKAKKQHDWL